MLGISHKAKKGHGQWVQLTFRLCLFLQCPSAYLQWGFLSSLVTAEFPSRSKEIHSSSERGMCSTPPGYTHRAKWATTENMQFFEHFPKRKKFMDTPAYEEVLLPKWSFLPNIARHTSGAASVHRRGQNWVTQVKGRVKKKRWTGNRGHWDQKAALNPDCWPDAQHLLCMHLYSRKLPFPGSVKSTQIWCKISQEEWSKMLPTPNRKVSLNVKTKDAKAAEQVLDYSWYHYKIQAIFEKHI